METVDEKKLFGKALGMYPGDAWTAACSVFSDDPGKALNAAQNWVSDITVIEAKHEYLDANGKALNVLTKEELAKKIITLADTTTIDVRDRLNAFKLFAELMDYMPKPNNVNVNDNRQMHVTQHVMLVPTSNNDDDWAEKARVQQAKLVSAD